MYLNFTSSSHSFCMSGPYLTETFKNCYIDDSTIDNYGMKCSGYHIILKQIEHYTNVKNQDVFQHKIFRLLLMLVRYIAIFLRTLLNHI